jgi:hypothetical protein
VALGMGCLREGMAITPSNGREKPEVNYYPIA